MKIKKKAPKKKDIAEADELQEMLREKLLKAGRTYEHYKSILLVSISVIILIAIAGVAYYYLSQKWDKEATVLEEKAYNYYLEGDFKNALDLYKGIIDKYPRSNAVPLSLFYTGNTYKELGEIDQAIKYYKQFIKKYGDQTPLLPLVYMNLGYVLMEKRDYPGAISAFKSAKNIKGSPVADRAIYEMARAYEISGDKMAALESYENLTKTYPTSPWAQDASARLEKNKDLPESTD